MKYSFRRLALKRRNQAIFRVYALRAAIARRPFPVDPASGFVVTMASYPGRIHQVPAVFESLARQTVKPKRAYLVLEEEEFPKRRVPRGIERLADRGIQVVWSRHNPYAVKKLVEVWGRDAHCSIAVFDDDFIYAPDVMQVLQEHAAGRKGTVLGYIGKEMLRRGRQLSIRYRKSAS